MEGAQRIAAQLRQQVQPDGLAQQLGGVEIGVVRERSQSQAEAAIVEVLASCHSLWQQDSWPERRFQAQQAVGLDERFAQQVGQLGR